jgi:hypothetical protein
MVAGAGHGTYVVLGLCSAPFGFFQDISLALNATPLLWGANGALLAGVPRRNVRAVFVISMLMHYVSVPLILSVGHFSDWDYVEKVSAFVTIAFIFYSIGQLAIWGTFVVLVRSRRDS